MKKKILLITIFIIMFSMIILTNRNTIHENQWENVAELSKNQPEYKYSIYFSRSMAVQQPNIYLKADKKFFSTKMPFKNESYKYDFKNYYKQKSFFDSLENIDITESYNYNFDIEKVNINHFSKISYENFYKSDDYINILDTVLFPISASLKSNDKKLPSLNLAEIIYFKEKNKGNNPYILCDDKFNSYVLVDENILDCFGNKVFIKNKFILIFNEDFVWYPLMNKDDTNQNEKLKKIVDIYGELKLPEMNFFQKSILNILKTTTHIQSIAEEKKVINYTSRDYDQTEIIFFNHSEARKRLTDSEIYELKSNSVYDINTDYINMLATICDYIVLCEISNQISPITSKYVTNLKNYNQSESDIYINLNRVISEFKANINCINSNKILLDLWFIPDYFIFNLNDILLTNGINCLNSSIAMSSIINLAYDNIDVSKVFTYLPQKGSHVNLSISYKNNMIRFENFENVSTGKNGYDLKDNTILRSIIKDNQWVVFENSDNKSNLIYTDSDISWVNSTLSNIPNKNISPILTQRFNYSSMPLKTCTIHYMLNLIDEKNIIFFQTKQ